MDEQEWRAATRSNSKGKQRATHSRSRSTVDLDNLFDRDFPSASPVESSKSRSIPSKKIHTDTPVASTSKLPLEPSTKRKKQPGKKREEGQVRIHATNLNAALKAAYRRRSNYDPSSSEHDSDSSSGTDSDEVKDSTIVGQVLWTAREKSLFFHSLARHSKLRLDLVTADIPTKSYLDIAGYIAHLDDISDKAFVSRGRPKDWGAFRSKFERTFAELPSARETSNRWITKEETMGDRLENYATEANRINEVLPATIAQVEDELRSGQKQITAKGKGKPESQIRLTQKIKPRLRLTNKEKILSNLDPTLLRALEFRRPRESWGMVMDYAQEYKTNPDAVFDLNFPPSTTQPPPFDSFSDEISLLPPIVNPFANAPPSSLPAANPPPTPPLSSTALDKAPTAPAVEYPEEEPTPAQNVESDEALDSSTGVTAGAGTTSNVAATTQGNAIGGGIDGEVGAGSSTSAAQRSTTGQVAYLDIKLKRSAMRGEELANSNAKAKDWRTVKLPPKRLVLLEPLGEDVARVTCALEEMEMDHRVLGGGAEFFNLATLADLVEKSQGDVGGIQGDVVGVFCRHLKNYVDRIITEAVKLRVAGKVLNEDASPENSLATPYILSAIHQHSLSTLPPLRKRQRLTDEQEELRLEQQSARKRIRVEGRLDEQSCLEHWESNMGRMDPFVPVEEDADEESLGRLFWDRAKDVESTGIAATASMGARSFPPLPTLPSFQLSSSSASKSTNRQLAIEFEPAPIVENEALLFELQEEEDLEAEEMDEQLDWDAEQERIAEFGGEKRCFSDEEGVEVEEQEVVVEEEGSVDAGAERERRRHAESIEPESPRAEAEQDDDDQQPADADDTAPPIDPLSVPLSWRRVSSHRPISKQRLRPKSSTKSAGAASRRKPGRPAGSTGTRRKPVGQARENFYQSAQFVDEREDSE